jgi:2-amino-4-hydroxy-6-hydroxymethyldihydropteridine diphosphokinase
MHSAWLLLGSNIEAPRNIPCALKLLAQRTSLAATSSVWQSPPADHSSQPEYWNVAVRVETPLAPEEIRENLIAPIESELGRVRTDDKFAARTIDIDLLLYDELVGVYSGHALPHPDILTRAFAAIPLAEIAPEKKHPVTAQSLRQIAQSLTQSGSMKRIGPVTL